MPFLSDVDLILAIKGRSRAGAEALFDRYAILIFKIIYTKVQDQEIADALLEQTFLLIWNSVDEFQRKNIRLSLWVASIAHCVSINALKTLKKPPINNQMIRIFNGMFIKS